MNTRLEHANLAVRDISEAIRFLQIAFPDFRIRGEGKSPLGRRWVHVGNEETYVAVNEAPEAPIERREPYSATPGLNHLGYAVEGVDALRTRLLEARYSESTIPNEHPHRTRIYFHDHEGNDWEFVEYHTDDTALRNDYELPGL